MLRISNPAHANSILTPQPAVQPARQVTLEEAHLRKQTLQRVELELAIST